MTLVIKNENKPHRRNAIIIANDTHMKLDKATIVGKQLNVNRNKLIVSCSDYTLELIKFFIINDIEFKFVDGSNNELILLLDASSVIEME